MPIRLRRTLALGTAAVCAAVPAASAASCPRNEPSSAAAIGSQVNDLRAGAGLAPLRTRPSIATAARVHSTAMARAGRLWHDDLRRWAGRSKAAQNVTEAVDAAEAVSLMAGSAPHRAALLTPAFSRIGVGAVRGCGGDLMVTVNLIA